MRKRGLEKQLILVGINRRMAENQYRREKVKTDDVLVTHAKKIRGFDREASRIRAGMSRCDVKMRDLARGVDMAEETEIEEETDEVLDAVTDRAMDRDPYQRASQRERFRMTAADFEEERAEDAVEEEAEHEERNPNGKEVERESEAIKRIVQELRDQDIADRQQAAAVVTDWAQTPSEEAHRDEHMQELLRKLPEAPTAELQ